eukprot:Anaeramoba_ignava/c17442_g1_i1.p1 GENE.c17442_g1_i1~~c17442_g1_i1.p1  ORF type:complete len:301 (-),score=91.09 c17442_g1_i1:207-986(-)
MKRRFLINEPNSSKIEENEKNNQLNLNEKIEKLSKFVDGIRSNDIETSFNSLVEIRKLLSTNKNPPINSIIQQGIVPDLVQFLKSNHKEFQFQAAWSLTNIASGTSEQTRIVVDSGTIPIFITLLDSDSEDIREQAVWALGNFAGDNLNYRDEIINNSNTINSILKILQNSSKVSVIRNTTWAISNLCRGDPYPNFQIFKPLLDTLVKLLNYNNKEIKIDILWSLSYLASSSSEAIDSILITGVCQTIVDLLVFVIIIY